MSEPIRESSPMIGPDSLRKINQVNESFFETHTKKNFGKEDVYGSKYSGTVENFGFEMLLEARKLKMQKPSLKGVFATNTFEYYFDLQYSNMIETYEQQGMLEAVLKKDLFLPNKEYRIRFENCEDVLIPRSESWGSLEPDPERLKDAVAKVFKDKFIHTTTPPILQIRDLRTMEYSEITLELSVGEDFAVDYYFYNEFATQSHIQSYSGGTLITTPITNQDAGLPFVWICEEIFKTYPPVEFVGDTNKLFVIGQDGHGVSHIYPYIYGDSSLPSLDEGTWMIYAYSEYDGFIPNAETNYASSVTSFKVVVLNNEGGIIQEFPIEFDTDYIKVMLSDKAEWKIERDEMNQAYYAQVELEQFFDNADLDTRVILLQAFDIKFSDEYLFLQYEGLIEGASSGIHLDTLSDYTDNAVDKLNGTIHSLGEFDGLPKYFKTMKDRETHRSHVELYTIRDRINQRTQNVLEKQTAGLIFDSAMPQKELDKSVAGQEPAIIYQPSEDDYLYVTDMDKVISQTNVLSEVTFNDVNTFGNCNIIADSKKQKFIYHGNRVFSLGAIMYDPENEIARVYYVGNDSTSYENNSSLPEEKRKPARTLARICDIPTTYEQLTHVKNTYATVVFDTKYVRTECGVNVDDIETLFNKRGMKLVMTPATHLYGNQWIYDLPADLPDKTTLITCGYCRWENTTNPNIPITDANFVKHNGGLNYQVGDTFYALVGGKAYDGEITDVSYTGYVNAFTIDVPDDSYVNVYNLEGTDTVLKTCTVNSENGEGFELKLDINNAYINAHTPTPVTTTPPENLVALAFDLYGDLFLYELNEDWEWVKVCQVGGTESVDNIYDDSVTRQERTFDNAFLKEITKYVSQCSRYIFYNPMQYISEREIINYAVGIKGDAETTDLSEHIVGLNNGNTYYKLICTDNADNGHFNLKMYQLEGYDNYSATLPRFNRNNTKEYFNPSNRFLVGMPEEDPFDNQKQPSIFVYMPSHNKRMDGFTSYTDTLLINSSHVMTYRDYGSDIVDSSYILSCNVYYYPEYERTQESIEFEEHMRQYQRSGLLTWIRDNLGSSAEPLLYEDTEYKYDYEALIKYIIDRYPFNGPVVKSDLKPHNYAGDLVVDPQTLLPLGTPPTGAFVPITTDIIEAQVTKDGTKLGSDLVNIFIIDDPTFQGFTSDFRVYDENEIDITSTALIVWRKNKYIFRNNEWIQLAKQIKEGYLNPSDNQFYYEPQYVNIITPDPDLIYQDIPTGQYYRWNGSSYILIII